MDVVTVTPLLLYAGIGSVAGFFAGLLGIGGGAIIGPLLLIVYTDFLDFPSAVATYMAVATASAVIVLTAPVGASIHARRGDVSWRLVLWLGIGTIGGAYVGAYGAVQVPPLLLKVALAGFLLLTSAFLLVSKEAGAGQILPARGLLSRRELLPVALVIGAVSAMLGIGGGALMVPYLHHRGVMIRRAIGTSACVGFPLALAASGSYILAGKGVEALPAQSWGYVYLPAFLGVAFFSVLAAAVGARLTGRLPASLLRKIFALMTAVIALRLLLSVL